MDNEMIERVAKVLSPQSWQAKDTPCDTKAKAKRREASLDFAARSIKAMREPTEKMVETGGNVTNYDDADVGDNLAKEIYRAMIDAVIND